MFDFEFTTPTILTVTALTSYLREVLDSDEVLRDIWARGEVSNFKPAASGHVYFTLKDANAQIHCVMWRSAAMRLRFELRNGMAVEGHGAVSLFAASGQVQLYLDSLRPAGEGALYQEFLRLKARLEAEGLFDPGHKRPLPQLPCHIGIVTSASGAALQDMLQTLGRRLPLARVTLAATAVQGVEAIAGIIAALKALNTLTDLDVILVARGGGSIEDLWAFNDEGVARAIYASRVPVISGVGHETDFTIADFVADLRAPTPTAAAELATPITLQDLSAQLNLQTNTLQNLAAGHVEVRKTRLSLAEAALRQHSPRARVLNAAQRQDDLRERLDLAFGNQLRRQRQQLDALTSRLGALNPESVLSRGFAILTDPDSGKVISRRNQAQPGQTFRARLQDGSFLARALEKQEGAEKND